MILNHYYNSKRNKIVGMDRIMLDWSIKNQKPGYMIVQLKYNKNKSEFKTILNNYILNIIKNNNSGNSFINKILNSENGKIEFKRKNLEDLIIFDDEFTINNCQNFFNSNYKQSLFFVFSKKYQIINLIWDHTIADGVRVQKLFGDLNHSVLTSKLINSSYCPIYTELSIIYGIYNNCIKNNFRSNNLIYDKNINKFNYSYIKKSEIDSIKIKYNCRFIIALMSIYYKRFFDIFDDDIKYLNIGLTFGFEDSYSSNNKYSFNLIKLEKSHNIKDLIESFKKQIYFNNFYSNYHGTRDYFQLLNTKYFNIKIDAIFTLLFGDVTDDMSIFTISPMGTVPLYTFVNSFKSSEYCSITTSYKIKNLNLPENQPFDIPLKPNIEYQNLRKNIFDTTTECSTNNMIKSIY